MVEQNGTGGRSPQTPDEIYKQFLADWSAIGQTVMAIASGIDRTQKSLAENAEAIAGAIDRARKLGSKIGATMIVVRDAWEKKAVPVLRIVKQNADMASSATEIGSDLASAGWVPWIHAPVRELLDCEDPVATFERWTTSEWESIAGKLTENAEKYDLGESPKRTMRAAILLHENGCYEQVPRVLFPEIEKCVAEHFYQSKIPHDENQLPEFRGIIEMIWGLATTGFALLAPTLGVGRDQMRILAMHSYMGSSKKNPAPALPNADCFPNRNRVLHGWESGDYHSPKASLNSLFLCDIMLQGLAFATALGGRGLKIENDGSFPGAN
jgi:hypothetical protein